MQARRSRPPGPAPPLRTGRRLGCRWRLVAGRASPSATFDSDAPPSAGPALSSNPPTLVPHNTTLTLTLAPSTSRWRSPLFWRASGGPPILATKQCTITPHQAPLPTPLQARRSRPPGRAHAEQAVADRAAALHPRRPPCDSDTSRPPSRPPSSFPQPAAPTPLLLPHWSRGVSPVDAGRRDQRMHSRLRARWGALARPP